MGQFELDSGREARADDSDSRYQKLLKDAGLLPSIGIEDPPVARQAEREPGSKQSADVPKLDIEGTDKIKPREVFIKPGADPEKNARLIQEAIDSASPAEKTIVRVAPGSYKGQIRFPDEARNIVLQGQELNGQRPIFNMEGIYPTEDSPAVFHLRNNSDVSISGFEISNFKAKRLETSAIGIFVEGYGDKISIENNIFKNMGLDKPHSIADRAGAEPILVTGTSVNPIKNLKISKNFLTNINQGQHEGITVTGNVDVFLIDSNRISGTNNIGIDVAGGYKVSPDPDQDFARNGIISNNIVSDIDTDKNRTYKKGDHSAGGIYVDGARHILIENNVVSMTNRGIEVGCEKPDHFSFDVIVRNNQLIQNQHAAVTVGAGDKNHGKTNKVLVENNIFRSNGVDRRTGVVKQLYVANLLDSNNLVLDDATGR